MAVALERADRPLLHRQRLAVKGVLAMEREQLGDEMREVGEKLQVALVTICNSQLTTKCTAYCIGSVVQFESLLPTSWVCVH